MAHGPALDGRKFVGLRSDEIIPSRRVEDTTMTRTKMTPGPGRLTQELQPAEAPMSTVAEPTPCALSRDDADPDQTSLPSPCAGELDGTVPPSPKQKKVRFDAQPITAIWPAVSDYDRKSIVVDLSKTPFALFRKDAVLMKTGTSADPSAPLPRPSPPAMPGQPPATPGRAVCRHRAPETAIAADCATTQVPSSPDAPSPTRRRSEPTGLWDSDSSDCGHTDVETDSSDCGHSDTDSNISFERRGSNSDGPAFYGVWKRTSSEGYEALLLSSGVPKRAVSMAARKHPVHIIDHDGTYFRLIVKNGLSKVDNTLFIGDEPSVDVIGKQSYEVSMNWAHLSGHGSKDELSLSSVCREKGEEVIAIRSLESGGNRMVLTQIVRRPAENYEVRAKHFFKRVTDRSELRSNGRAPSSNVVTVRRKKKC